MRSSYEISKNVIANADAILGWYSYSVLLRQPPTYLIQKLSTKASVFCIVLLFLEFKRMIILSS